MPAQPAHLWSTRGKQAPSTDMPVQRCQGVACMFLTVRLASAAVGSPYTQGKKHVHSCTLATRSWATPAPDVVSKASWRQTGQRRLWGCVRLPMTPASAVRVLRTIRQ
jgi:hypothetical protein